LHEEILPYGIDEVDSYTIKSIGPQGDVHKEYEKSSIDRNPPVYLCLTIRKDEQHIVFTNVGGQEKFGEKP